MYFREYPQGSTMKRYANAAAKTKTTNDTDTDLNLSLKRSGKKKGG